MNDHLILNRLKASKRHNKNALIKPGNIIATDSPLTDTS